MNLVDPHDHILKVLSQYCHFWSSYMGQSQTAGEREEEITSNQCGHIRKVSKISQFLANYLDFNCVAMVMIGHEK